MLRDVVWMLFVSKVPHSALASVSKGLLCARQLTHGYDGVAQVKYRPIGMKTLRHYSAASSFSYILKLLKDYIRPCKPN